MYSVTNNRNWYCITFSWIELSSYGRMPALYRGVALPILVGSGRLSRYRFVQLRCSAIASCNSLWINAFLKYYSMYFNLTLGYIKQTVNLNYLSQVINNQGQSPSGIFVHILWKLLGLLSIRGHDSSWKIGYRLNFTSTVSKQFYHTSHL